YLVDEITIHAAVGMGCPRDAAGDTSFDLRRHDFPAKEDRVAVAETAEIVVLADVPMLPHHLAVPVILPQQAAATANVLRAFGELAGPEQIAGVKEISVRSGYDGMFPLVYDFPVHTDQISGFAVERREQRVARCRLLETHQKPKVTVTH